MRKSSHVQIAVIAGIALSLAGAGSGLKAQRAPASAVQVGSTDLGGVVTSSKGPEAGVWVIAETRDLPTKFAKVVVTDDQGRYLIPELPKASYEVWVRGYGLVDSQKVKAENRRTPQLPRRARAERGSSGRILSRRLLVLAASDPAEKRLPGHRPERQRHSGRHEDATLLDRHGEELVPVVSRPRFQGHAYAREGMGRKHQLARCMDPPGTGWTGKRKHGANTRPIRPQSVVGICGLDGSHCSRRTAQRETAAASGGRA